jgi:cytochrome b involved in lipid metabolism
MVRDCQLWGNDNTNLWIVENKLYDLTDFINKHPGGSSWLELTKGQDITEHFIVHHLR